MAEGAARGERGILPQWGKRPHVSLCMGLIGEALAKSIFTPFDVIDVVEARVNE
jgi:hypothetical protein